MLRDFLVAPRAKQILLCLLLDFICVYLDHTFIAYILSKHYERKQKLTEGEKIKLLALLQRKPRTMGCKRSSKKRKKNKLKKDKLLEEFEGKFNIETYKNLLHIIPKKKLSKGVQKEWFQISHGKRKQKRSLEYNSQ